MVEIVALLLLCLPVIIIIACIIVGVVQIVSLIRTGDYYHRRSQQQGGLIAKPDIDIAIPGNGVLSTEDSGDFYAQQRLVLLSQMMHILNGRLNKLLDDMQKESKKEIIPAEVIYFDSGYQDKFAEVFSVAKKHKIYCLSITVDGKRYLIWDDGPGTQKKVVYQSGVKSRRGKYKSDPIIKAAIEREKRRRSEMILYQKGGVLPVKKEIVGPFLPPGKRSGGTVSTTAVTTSDE